MKRIQIGNDFRVSWTLTQLGEAFNLVGKTYDIEVSSPYGVILVSDVVAEDNVLSFNIPASQQVYLGNYDITLKITNDDGQMWRLKQCDAFALVSCDCGDVVEIVQLSSGIVYPVTKAAISHITNNITNNITIYNSVLLEVFGEHYSYYDPEEEDIITRQYLRAVIQGKLDDNKSYCYRLMRRRTNNKTSGKKDEDTEYRGQRKCGWVPTRIEKLQPGTSRLADWVGEGDYRDVTYYDGDKINKKDYGYILMSASDDEPVTPFRLIAPYITQDDSADNWNAPTGRHHKSKIKDPDSSKDTISTCVICNQFGIALWETDDDGKPIKQVSNVVRVGVSINIGKFYYDPWNESAYYWSNIG